jgi:hypothetical protein
MDDVIRAVVNATLAGVQIPSSRPFDAASGGAQDEPQLRCAPGS